jgi:hypothetical protein
MTHQSDEKHINDMSEYFVGVFNIAFNRYTIVLYCVSLSNNLLKYL